MLSIKRKQLILGICLLLSFGYFSTISSLEINAFLKGEIILIPLQAIAITYLYLRYSRKS
jgi:hypothetical protein